VALGPEKCSHIIGGATVVGSSVTGDFEDGLSIWRVVSGTAFAGPEWTIVRS
jgi:hypothetical protein